MNIRDIIKSKNPYDDLIDVLDILHREGPSDSNILETLSFYKKFHPTAFSDFEERIISALGLFYKIKEPNNLYSFILAGFGNQHKKVYGEYLTPVQASVRRAIDNNQFVSVSAPTSAGKSYSIRDFIAEQNGDAVIIVPSRALIAEYINTIKRRFKGDKTVMVSPFIDKVFTSRNLRRVFIVTPERARDLFANNIKLNVNVFFFDEAHVSEEKERGVIFDVLVRRVQKHFPKAKLIFAHPFVENPEAQLKKHEFSKNTGYARSYTHGSVGKLCIFKHSNGKNFYFSPYTDNGHLIKNCVEFPNDFDKFAFNGEHSVLVYVSKASIYNGSFLNDFNKYIKKFSSVKDPKALEIIEAVEHILGADQKGHNSNLVSLLHKGVVIHHGSVPLEVRFLVEDFIRNGNAKICFATSTLAQGVNMPFDIVWLDNMRIIGNQISDRALAFKNLIGRSGRLSTKMQFDFGYVFTKKPKLFIERINDKFRLNEKSVIDSPIDDDLSDSAELIESIKSGTFNDEKHIPESKVERLSKKKVLSAAETILNLIYKSGGTIAENLSGQNNKENRDEIRDCFQYIFEASIDRKLFDGETSVFKQAISLFLQTIQGRSFREIVGIRYNYISKRDQRHLGTAEFSQPAQKLPDSKLQNRYSIFSKDTLAKNVSYDAVVFDTYDYLDQVISFSLSDVFVAVFKIYNEKKSDRRSEKMIELLRFGTNNNIHTLLMRYGFPPDDVAQIAPYILSINEENITFKKEINQSPKYIKKIVEWYLP